jgi:phosphatidylserine/phosphatidylglycerophosphate/cardiolipin synthase-like enzyme
VADEFEVAGSNDSALFTLTVRRGEGMALLAMNWKDGMPPDDFVGFGIEYQEPSGTKFYPLNNRLNFTDDQSQTHGKRQFSTLEAPIQKFRWVHFPFHGGLMGEFLYRVTPVFMNKDDTLRYGDGQTASISLGGDTYPGILNVGFTRGFISSQAFVDNYESAGPISELLPASADQGLAFEPTHPKKDEALPWMGFEARGEILDLLDVAIADPTAQVRVVAYDLNQPEVVSRLKQLGDRLKIIIDDSGSHGPLGSAESQAATQLANSGASVKREHMLDLQHNKTIVVDGAEKAAVCGSTNYSWRGFYVQNNNAVTLRGDGAVSAFLAAFQSYWDNDQDPAAFESTASAAAWIDLGLEGLDAKVAFSPHSGENARLAEITNDIENNTTSSLFYSFAFLYQTPDLEAALQKVSENNAIFVYGISDRHAGGIHLLDPGGNPEPVFPAALSANLPAPFSAEPTAGSGVQMHHKFAVIDFDRPTARVYFGSYNFSSSADTKNGENVLLVKDRKIAVAYMVEALRIFDHYSFRLAQTKATDAQKPILLHKPPRQPGEKPWWDEDWTDPVKERDRLLFA